MIAIRINAAIAHHMKSFSLQWDYISIEMGKPKFAEALEVWRSMLLPQPTEGI